MRKTRSRRRAGKRSGRRRLLLPLAVALVAASAVYAFTAAISFSGTVQAGDGVGSPTTPSITSMYFTYNSNTPTQVSSVTLNFSSSVNSVLASLVGTWSNSCSGSGSGPWTCTWSSNPTVSGINGNKTLQVVAS
jgi:hypothetical protein